MWAAGPSPHYACAPPGRVTASMAFSLKRTEWRLFLYIVSGSGRACRRPLDGQEAIGTRAGGRAQGEEQSDEQSRGRQRPTPDEADARRLGVRLRRRDSRRGEEADSEEGDEGPGQRGQQEAAAVHAGMVGRMSAKVNSPRS
jgi:hypothetical protein